MFSLHACSPQAATVAVISQSVRETASPGETRPDQSPSQPDAATCPGADSESITDFDVRQVPETAEPPALACFPFTPR
jgi:hypothetical protein